MIRAQKAFYEHLPAAFDGVFNWDWLIPAFAGTKIEPTDIDAVVERRGKVLFFETKPNGKQVSTGQQITLETLVRLGRGAIRVMILYGKNQEDIQSMEEYRYIDGRVAKREINCNRETVLNRVKAWFDWANSH